MSSSSNHTLTSLLSQLHSLTNLKNIEGMKRYGITSKKVLGISAPVMRSIAKTIGKNHTLALQLWKTGIYEARQIASLIDDPKLVTEKQMDAWAKAFDNWAICDGCCMNLFDKTPFAYAKAHEWSSAEPEFVKRAGFALMAALAVHDKKTPDASFLDFFPDLLRGSSDERNLVKKAVNWALRQIGKRNLTLHSKAILLSEKIQALGTQSARWIASDALRELRSYAVITRLKAREKRQAYSK